MNLKEQIFDWIENKKAEFIVWIMNLLINSDEFAPQLMEKYIDLQQEQRKKELFLKFKNNDKDFESLFDLAEILIEEEDYINAFLSYLKIYNSKDKNYEHAAYCIGILYFQGNGLEQNLEKAAKWLERAMDAGHTQSSLYLGDIYYKIHFKDIQQNKFDDNVPSFMFAKVKNIYERAAKYRMPSAAYNLFVMHRKHTYNKREELKWLKIADLLEYGDLSNEINKLEEIIPKETLTQVNNDVNTFRMETKI